MKTLVNFDKNQGLVPAIIQDSVNKQIYMLGYMNSAALQKTQETGFVFFWSRRRNALWMKGEESGNKLRVKRIFLDCDQDCLLVEVELLGKTVCHTGSFTCFKKL